MDGSTREQRGLFQQPKEIQYGHWSPIIDKKVDATNSLGLVFDTTKREDDIELNSIPGPPYNIKEDSTNEVKSEEVGKKFSEHHGINNKLALDAVSKSSNQKTKSTWFKTNSEEETVRKAWLLRTKQRRNELFPGFNSFDVHV